MVFILMILANKYNSHTFLCSFQFVHIGIDIFSSFYITTKPHQSVGTVSRELFSAFSVMGFLNKLKQFKLF